MIEHKRVECPWCNRLQFMTASEFTFTKPSGVLSHHIEMHCRDERRCGREFDVYLTVGEVVMLPVLRAEGW